MDENPTTTARRARRRSRIELALILILLFSVRAADTSDESLKGVRAMSVTLSGDFQIGDLTQEQLQTDVELRLRQNGITVVRDVRQNPGRPTLQIVLAFYDAQKSNERINGYSFAVLCEFRQEVYLVRSKVSTEASTWSKLAVGMTNRDVIKDHLRRVVAEVVDRFINVFCPSTQNSSDGQGRLFGVATCYNVGHVKSYSSIL